MMNSDCRLPSVRETFHVILATFTVYLILVFLSGQSDSKFRLLLYETGIVAPALVYVLLKRYNFRAVFRWRRVPLKLSALGVMIGAGLNVLTDELNALIQNRIPMQKEVLDALNRAMVFESFPDFLCLFIGGVLIAGLGEEMLFRGLLQGVLERAMDVTKGVLFSSMIFTFLHFNPWWTIQILILGVLTGVLTWRSGSIFPAVAAHTTINGISLLILNVDEGRLAWYFKGAHVHPAGLFIALLLVVGGFILFYRWTESKR